MQIFLEDSHTRKSSFCHLTTAADAAAVAVDGEAAAEVAAAAVADAAAAVAAAVDAAEDVAGPGYKFESGVDNKPANNYNNSITFQTLYE